MRDHRSAMEGAKENFGKDAFAKLPGMFKMMMAPEKVYVMKARKVGDRDRVAAHWDNVLSWPARVVMTYHDPPGHAFRRRRPGSLARCRARSRTTPAQACAHIGG
jgi:hypothetical protein